MSNTITYDSQNFDMKRTIENTLERAKGCFLARYPSLKYPNDDFHIDVRYPGEGIPSCAGDIIPTSMDSSRMDLSTKPVCIIMKRRGTEVYLRKNTYTNQHNRQKHSYIFSIYTPTHHYRAIATPDGCVKEEGESLLLVALKRDEDFNKYISLINKDDQTPTAPLWPMKKIAIAARTLKSAGM